jgi:hypothetical protein
MCDLTNKKNTAIFSLLVTAGHRYCNKNNLLIQGDFMAERKLKTKEAAKYIGRSIPRMVQYLADDQSIADKSKRRFPRANLCECGATYLVPEGDLKAELKRQKATQAEKRKLALKRRGRV